MTQMYWTLKCEPESLQRVEIHPFLYLGTLLVCSSGWSFSSVTWVQNGCHGNVNKFRAGPLYLEAGSLTLLPVRCIVSPSYFKEPQTEPLLGERIVFWPLFCCYSPSYCNSAEICWCYGKCAPWSPCCCVTRRLVMVSAVRFQYISVLRGGFVTTQGHWTHWALNRSWTHWAETAVILYKENLVKDLICHKVGVLP